MLKKIKEALFQPVIKNMAIYALTDGLSKSVPFLIMPVIALYLNPSQFGIASNFMVFSQMIGGFIGLNTQSYYSVDYYRTDRSQKAPLLSNLIIINIAITLISFVVILFTSSYIRTFFVIALEWQLLGCLMMFFSAVTDLFVVYLRMEEKLKQYSHYQILSSVSSAALSLLFIAVFLMSWQGRIYALVLSNLLMFVLAMYAFSKNDMLNFTFDKKRFISGLKFGIPLLPHKLSTWIRSGFDRVVITKKVGILDNGLFSFGSNISNAATLFTTSFFGAFTPYVYKQLKVGEDDITRESLIKRNIVKKCYLATLVFAILLLLGYVVLTVFVKLLFDHSYQASIIYFPFFFIGIFFNFIYSFVSIFVFYSKSTKFLGIFTFAVAILQAAGTIPLVNLYGTLGASYSLLIGSFLKAFVVIFYSQKVFPMPWLFNTARTS